MSAGEKFLKTLSAKNSKRIRSIYRRAKRLWYPKLTEEKFREILTEQLGVKKGSVVFIHSSLDNLNIAFPLSRVFPILLDVVGEEGTLVFPCWHYNQPAVEYLKNKDSLFDINESPSLLGILTELARRYPGAHRSLHPTSSCVSIGKYAEEITKDHHLSVLPCDEHSPLYKIIKLNGIIIGLGVNSYNLSFVHCVEDVMKEKFPVKTRTDEVFETKVKDAEGKIIVMKTKAPHPQIKHRNIQKYFKEHIPARVGRDFYINGTKHFTANSGELFDKMAELATKGITIYTKEANIKN
jgi:aminoglycoside 3-N-acetyltransferase